MKIIYSDDEFESAFETTKRVALKSFANDDVYLEKFIKQPKHIEVQILGDKKGITSTCLKENAQYSEDIKKLLKRHHLHS